jgi:hypothetical protein
LEIQGGVTAPVLFGLIPVFFQKFAINAIYFKKKEKKEDIFGQKCPIFGGKKKKTFSFNLGGIFRAFLKKKRSSPFFGNSGGSNCTRLFLANFLLFCKNLQKMPFSGKEKNNSTFSYKNAIYGVKKKKNNKL